MPPPIPNRLEVLRLNLFTLQSPVTMSVTEFQQYSDIMSKIWGYANKRSQLRHGKQSIWYRCPMWDPRQWGAKACGMRIHVLVYCVDDQPARYVVERTERSSTEHSHTLGEIDQPKRRGWNFKGGRRRTATGSNVAEALTDSGVIDLQDDGDALPAAGGRYMTRHAVANTSAARLERDQDPASTQNESAPRDERVVSLQSNALPVAGWSQADVDTGAPRPTARPSMGLVGNERPAWAEELVDLQDWCKRNGYLSEKIFATARVDMLPSNGLVFAAEHRVELLRDRGYLSIMGSTRHVNRLGWLLYTVMIRDEQGKFRPVVHCLTEKEDADITVEALKVLKRWCGGRDAWRLRYVLTNDSATAQLAIPRAFPGPAAGESEVTHVLCLNHCDKTLRKRLAGRKYKKAMEWMQTALRNENTRRGCEELILNAIRDAPDENTKRYIQKEWLRTMPLWAHYARAGSPLLLQVKTTSKIGSWHSHIKAKAGKMFLHQYSLQGCAEHVLNLAEEYDMASATLIAQKEKKVLPQVADYPFLKRLPLLAQMMVIGQIKQVKRLLFDSSNPIQDPEDEESLACSCSFYRSYRLPCRHIFQNHELGLYYVTQAHWDRWTSMFCNCGFETYESIAAGLYEERGDPDVGAPVRRRLDLRRVADSLFAKYQWLEDRVQHMSQADADLIMKWWLSKLDELRGEMTCLSLPDFAAEMAQQKISKEELEKLFDGPQSVGAVIEQEDGEIPVLNGVSEGDEAGAMIEQADDEALVFNEVNDGDDDVSYVDSEEEEE